MPTQIGELGVTFPDSTVQTTAAIAGGAGFGGAPNASIYTATGFWICPTGIYKVRVTVVGGGGGAYGYGAGEAYIGGGPGGCAIGLFAVTPGTTYSLVVGIGGALGANNPGGGPPGGTGGTSSFASFCSATGGIGGTFETPGRPGTGLNGNIRNSQSVQSGGQLGGIPESSTLGMSILTTGLTERVESGASPQAWSINSPWIAGAAGNGTYGSGGMNGAVMIEWWG
jgi:hypothetical protein